MGKKQEELRRVVIDNEQFIRDTDIKTEKAEKKAREEQLECRKLDEELKTLGVQLEELQGEKDAEMKRIQQNSRYKRYLDAVVQQYEEDFEGDVENLIQRHVTLEAGNDELHKQNE